MRITRHFLTVGERRVHYRRCGEGPPLLMVHQSPRSSAEYERLMREWGTHFTCVAPDTPGFGQSDGLPMVAPEIDDFADALANFARALGIARTAAYGFHSGGVILVTALKRHPDLFTGLAIGGYAIWTPEEIAAFGAAYLPPFRPSAYGEHLSWLWNRILEQSWFFPWFDARPETRLPNAHDDPGRVDAIVREMLDAGDAYRFGYGAVLRAPRDIPPPDSRTPPVLITAYDGDPLQAHIDRIGAMPANWSARKLSAPEEHEAASLEFLRAHAGPTANFAEDANGGWLPIAAGDFEGLIHWRGARGADILTIHAPGSEASLNADGAMLAIDMPGHGLSDGWPNDAPLDRAPWQAVAQVAASALGASRVALPAAPPGDPERLFPDLTPDRHGAYLTTAWSIVRARRFFAPWYEVKAANAVPFAPEDIAPERLALEHRALIRARAARAYATALAQGGGNGNS